MNASNSTRLAKVIAVDGPSGSGKSSISKGAAKKLGYSFLDTGAMYRAITWFLLQDQLVDEKDIKSKLDSNSFKLEISTDTNFDSVKVNQKNITQEIRTNEITSQVSFYAALPFIRQFLVSLQRDLVSKSSDGIVVEGRDIGTVVLPNADVKIFITASEVERARRRALQINTDLDTVLEAQRLRDSYDSNREISPLKVPDSATILDNTNLDLEQSISEFIRIVDSVK